VLPAPLPVEKLEPPTGPTDVLTVDGTVVVAGVPGVVVAGVVSNPVVPMPDTRLPGAEFVTGEVTVTVTGAVTGRLVDEGATYGALVMKPSEAPLLDTVVKPATDLGAEVAANGLARKFW